MSPGVLAQIKSEWRTVYRAPGSRFAGIVQSLSPTGNVARIRLDDVADSYILVTHLEPAIARAGSLGLDPVAERSRRLDRRAVAAH